MCSINLSTLQKRKTTNGASDYKDWEYVVQTGTNALKKYNVNSKLGKEKDY